jgi:hypothetical protein
MKITFVGHAAILIETRGLRILSDPWWQGPCFGNEWWIYPRPDLRAVEGKIDYIYISHGHADHFHRGTLRRFPKGTKVLVSSALDLEPHLAEMGFEVVAIGPNEERELENGVRCRIMPTYSDDTLMAIADGSEVCLNLNDAVHAAPRPVQDSVTARLKEFYPKIDYVFCGYGVASHFPNCYIIPGKDDVGTLVHRQRYFNAQWAYVIDKLKPRFGFPFAANVVFLSEHLWWANEPLHNTERPTNVFLKTYGDRSTQVVDIDPGFIVADGRIVSDVRFHPVGAKEIAETYGSEMKTQSRLPRQDEGSKILIERLQHNIAIARPWLLEHRGDYRFLLSVWDRTWALEIVKSRNSITVADVDAKGLVAKNYDIVFSSFFSYLRRSFTTTHGHETLFVGSGIIIAYPDRAKAMRNLHREFVPLLSKLEKAPTSRFGDQPRWLFSLKTTIKRLIGRRAEPDLYDLGGWTRFLTE